jgi:hypothetical protein
MRRSICGVACILVGLAVLPESAEATTISGSAYTIGFSAATCTACWGAAQSLPSVSIEGMLTIVPANATFWDPVFATYLNENAWMVTDVSGSLDIGCIAANGCAKAASFPLSFVPAGKAADGWAAPLGAGSYLLTGNLPRYVVFSASGSGLNTRIINDNAFNLFQWGSPLTRFGSQVPITWQAFSVPDRASSLGMFLLSLGSLIALKRQAA